MRRRKPIRHLRLVDDEALGWPSAEETPPIMWSGPGSGFEADPFSPAGRMQREWWFLRRVGRLTDRELGIRAAWAVRAAAPVIGFIALCAVVAGLLSVVVGVGVSLAIVGFVLILWFMKVNDGR